MVHFFDQIVYGFSRHFFYVHLIGGNTHLTDPRMNEVVKSNHGNILRYSVTFLLQRIDQNTCREITVTHESSGHLFRKHEIKVIPSLPIIDISVADNPVRLYLLSMLK